jgi:hypothetical protein
MTICTHGNTTDVHIRKPWTDVNIRADAAPDMDNMDELYIILGEVIRVVRVCVCGGAHLRVAPCVAVLNFSVAHEISFYVQVTLHFESNDGVKVAKVCLSWLQDEDEEELMKSQRKRILV